MQRLSIVYVEPTGMRQGGVSAGYVIVLRVKTTERNRRSIMPPVFPNKIFY
jgi:hypothetical protein